MSYPASLCIRFRISLLLMIPAGDRPESHLLPKPAPPPPPLGVVYACDCAALGLPDAALLHKLSWVMTASVEDDGGGAGIDADVGGVRKAGREEAD